MMIQRIQRLTVIVISLISSGVFAADLNQSEKWLEQSDRLSAGVEPGGVYGRYEMVQLQLVQALTYARMGRADDVLDHLPFSGGDDDWMSGGDGMVRQLLVGDALRQVHATLFRSLAGRDEKKIADNYVKGLSGLQRTPDLFFELGFAFGATHQSSALEGQQLAQFLAGAARHALANSDEAGALKMLGSIDLSLRDNLLDQLGQLMMLDDDWIQMTALYRLMVEHRMVDSSRMLLAISLAVRAGQLDSAERLIELLGDQATEAHRVQLALAYTQQGSKQARRLFESEDKKQDRSWESVAIQIGADDWLVDYYQQLEDPWRRAERFYQLAKRQISAGEADAAQASARLALKAAKQISSAATRALAYQQLAEFHARAGEPEMVTKLIVLIGAEESVARYRQKAQVQLAVGWAVAGKIDQVLEAVDSIPLMPGKVAALTASARIINSGERFDRLVKIAHEAALAISEARTAGNAWRQIVEMQISVNDIAGAQVSASVAQANGQGPVAYEALVAHFLSINRFDDAIAAAMRLPEDQQFRRQKALAEVVAAAATGGQPDIALGLLAGINQKNIREINIPLVARALVEAGRSEEAETIVSTITRSDTRADVLSVLSYAHAQKQILPSASLMNQAPRRGGAGLCWAVAASIKVQANVMADWLGQLEHPQCLAFAFAGAAYSQLEARDTSLIFSLVDPMKTSERMNEAMQRTAVFQRYR